MRRTVACLALAALVGATSTLTAQSRRGRDPGRDRGLVELDHGSQRGGFFITGGIGAGGEQYRFEDDDDYTDRLTKPTLMLRLGGTPNSSVRIGGELFGWGNDVVDSDEQPGGTEQFGAALLSAQYFPMRNGGLFLKAGGGIGVSGFDFDDPAFEDNTETGFAWSIGAGFDIPLSRNFSIGPSIDLYQANFTQRDEPSLSERVVNIGVQFTFQSGGRWR